MRQFLFLALLVVPALCRAGHPGHFSVGPKIQRTYNFQWENDLEAGYTHEKLWDRRIQFSLSYVTNRLGSKLGTTAAAQDYYHLTTSLHIRPFRYFDPQIAADLGYYRYSINPDFEEATGVDPADWLDNQSPLLNLGFGLASHPRPHIGSLYLGCGYRVFQGADLLYPLYFNLGFLFNIPGGGSR